MKKFIKKIYFLKDFNFVLIHIICKMLVLPKSYLNYLWDNIFECFFKKYNRLKKKKTSFFSKYMIMESLNPKE